MKHINRLFNSASKWYIPRRQGKSISQMLVDSLYEDLEESLLAVMAAGVPASCIEVTKPEFIKCPKLLSCHLEVHIKFIGRV